MTSTRSSTAAAARRTGGGRPLTTVTRLHCAAGPMPLAEATRRFLRRDAFEPSTRVSYGRTLSALIEVMDAEIGVATVTEEQLERLLERW